MLNSDVIFALVMMIVSILFFIWSLPFPGGTSDGVPGPGYFPIILSIAIFILSFRLFISKIRSSEELFFVNEKLKRNLKPFLLTIIAIIGFMVVWKVAHFLAAAFSLLLALSFIYKQKPVFGFIFSAITALLIYYMFSTLLNVRLQL